MTYSMNDLKDGKEVAGWYVSGKLPLMKRTIRAYVDRKGVSYPAFVGEDGHAMSQRVPRIFYIFDTFKKALRFKDGVAIEGVGNNLDKISDTLGRTSKYIEYINNEGLTDAYKQLHADIKLIENMLTRL